MKRSFGKQRGEKYRRKYYSKPNPKRHRFFRKLFITLHEKTVVSVGHAKK